MKMRMGIPGLVSVQFNEPALKKIAEATGRSIVQQIVRRTRKGKDMNGKPFVKYSEKYKAQREASGRKGSPVDLTLSGEMLGSVSILKTQRSGSRLLTRSGINTTSVKHVHTHFMVTIGPGPGSGKNLKFKAGGIYKRGKNKGQQKKGKFVDVGGKAPTHNEKGSKLHYGKGRLPPRPWLGLTKKQSAVIKKSIEKLIKSLVTVKKGSG